MRCLEIISEASRRLPPALKVHAVQMDLVLLHALPFNGSMWAAQQMLLPRRTHAPTLYGLGATVTEWAAAVLDRVEARRLVVVGNSVGGSCALEMAALAPDRIAALVLIGAKARHRPDPALHSEAVACLRRNGVQAAWIKYWEPLISPDAPADLKHQAMRQAARLPWETIARGVNAFHTRPSRDDLLPRMTCPVVCISGEHDVAPGPAVTADQARSAPDGRVMIVPDCGHYVPFEKPLALNGMLQSLIEELI